MTNLEKYNEVFCEVFGVSLEQLNSDFTNESIAEWDSIGHMNLISTIEETFDIMLDGEDIMQFQSYEQGKDILKKYSIEV